MKVFAVLSIILAGIFWGVIGIFVRGLTDLGFSSMEIVALRSFASLLVMSLYLVLFKRDRFRFHLKDWWCFAGTGIVSILFFNLCYFTAINLTTLATASILLYTAPVFVMFFSLILFREKLTVLKCVSAVIAFLGCALVSGILPGGNLALNPTGLLCGLGAGLGYALYSIFGRYALNRGYDTLTVTFYSFAFSSAGCLFFTNIPSVAARVAATPASLWWVLGIGILPGAAAYLLYTYGLTKVESSRASIMASVEPAVAALVGVAAFQEILTPWALAGICLVLGSIVLLNAKGIKDSFSLKRARE